MGVPTVHVSAEAADPRSMSMSSRHLAPRPARSRVGSVLFALATACGLWFGATAPEVSPVAPVPAANVQQAPGPGDAP